MYTHTVPIYALLSIPHTRSSSVSAEKYMPLFCIRKEIRSISSRLSVSERSWQISRQASSSSYRLPKFSRCESNTGRLVMARMRASSSFMAKGLGR